MIPMFKNKLFKTGAKFSVASSTSAIITMVIGLVMMRWLFPYEIGKWNEVSIFGSYLPFLQLGIQTGLSVELPIKLGSNDSEKVKTHIATGYWFAIFISIVILILGAALTYIYYNKGGLDSALGVMTITICGICTSFTLHATARFRSSKAFDDLTKVIWLTIPFTLFSVFFIYKFHYYGVLLYNVIPAIAGVVLRWIYLPFKNVRPKFFKDDMGSLLRVGIALLIPNNLHNAAQTLPRWIILKFANVATLGLFSPAIAVNGLISLLPTQIAQFFHPQMGYIYGQTGKARDTWSYVKKMNLYMPLAALPIVITIWLLAPWGLKVFFPKYVESMWAMRIMSIAFLFSCSFTTLVVFFTIHAYKYAYIVTITDFIGCFVFPFICAKIMDANILTSVTIGLLINNIVVYLLNFLLLRYALHLKKYNGNC